MPVSIPENIEVKDEQGIIDAQTVLVSLGYENAEIKSAVKKALLNIKDTSNAEEILKEALRFLSI